MFSQITSLIKAAAIRSADVLTAAADPFDPLNRPSFLRRSERLLDKAYQFEADIRARFMLRGNTIVNYRIPLPEGSPTDLGDQAVWHGVATAAMCFKFKVEGLDSSFIAGCLEGLAAHQPNGILMRGLDEKNNTAWDASNDSATGHLVGLWYLWRFAPRDVAESAATLLHQWARTVLANGHALVNPDGKPTTYGQLEQGWKSDPLRITLLLALYKCTFSASGDPVFREAYEVLIRKYLLLITVPKARLLWWDNRNDTHRAALHLLLLHQNDPSIRAECRSGLERIWNLEKESGNSWVAAVAALADPSLMRGQEPTATFLLHEFDLAAKGPAVEAINDTSPQLQKVMKFFRWGGELMGSMPIPIWMAGTQDFVWQRNLRSARRWVGQKEPSTIYNGVDYLAPYWAGRLSGIIDDHL